MKKEVFIMHDFKALCRQAHTLVIFKSLHEVPVFEKLLDTLAVCESDSDMAIEKYSDFVAELFAYSDNLTEYMLKLVLENENLFMLKKGEGKETGALLEECLANELAVIEELSQIPCDEIISKIDYDGFLPRYATQKLDFSQIYADRIHAIGQYGYGIYSQYHVFVIKDGKIVPVEYPDDIKLPMLLIGGSDLFYNLVVYFFMFLLRGRFSFLYYLKSIIIPEFVYTMVISILLYLVFLKLNQKLEAHEKRRAKKFDL